MAPWPTGHGEHFRLRRHENRRLRNLQARAAGLRRLRAFFDERDFLEIDPPQLVPSPGLELHLDAFVVEGAGYLITSPEYQLKRLLAARLPRIYSLCHCFRRGELGPQHNPEFTLAEWYRSPGGWEEVAADVEQLCAAVVSAVAGGTVVERPAGTVDLAPPWQRLSVREAMSRYAGLTLDGDEPVDELARRIEAAGFGAARGAGPLRWDDLFFSVFLEAVEPRLGQGRPTVLYDWPARLAALARRKPGDPSVVERFEAYAGGLELCNGFGELVDPVEQRRRLEADLAERRHRGLPLYPIDERFLAALAEGLPPSAGVALGFDRLMMLATGATAIREVLPFSLEEL